MKRLERESLIADRASVERMLSRLTDGDVVGRSSFERRLSDINTELAKLGDRIDTAGSVALMFGGAPVHGSRGIDAEFATKTIENFHALVSRQLAVAELGTLGSRGPISSRTEPNLAITEIVRGSVGFLLEERSRNEEIADTAVKLAIDEVTELVTKTASEEEADFQEAVEALDPRQVIALRNFFRTLDESGATIRIVEDVRDASLDAKAIRRARSRVDATEISENEVDTVVGELWGVLPDGRRFEMKLEGGEVISGSVAAGYIPKYLEFIHGPHGEIVGRKWRAKMRIREVKEFNKPPRKLYTLVGLLEQVS